MCTLSISRIFCIWLLVLHSLIPHNANTLNTDELKNRVKAMFYHAYDGYIRYAYPLDELRPLTCDGHDTWGSFSLTLVDALDTLAVMGNWSEFRRASQMLLDHLDLNRNKNVSVFETNIRVVGGLISAHLLSRRAGFRVESTWPCSGPLLHQAVLFARKLLPAFDTPTGMPYGTVNLASNSVPPNETTITCVATIGTLILEFGTLTRLTGDPRFEAVALRALRALWKYRSSKGLLGNHIDVATGKWTAEEATIGGGVDSLFEYLVKGAALFRLPELDAMFREYKRSIDRYLKHGDWHMVVNKNSGHVSQAIFQGLDAYWPGILVLTGDVDDALRHVTAYHEVWKQYGFIPEAYNLLTREAMARGSSYHLRPEFIESVYYLYRATKDPIFLQMGNDVLTSIETITRTSCGYATVMDVNTHKLDNRMESFFLSETTKYLYLLFDENNFLNALPGDHSISSPTPSSTGTQCLAESGGYIFNTEAHPIDPGSLDCCYSWNPELSAEESVVPDDTDPFTLMSELELLRKREIEFNPLKELVTLMDMAFGQLPAETGDDNVGSANHQPRLTMDLRHLKNDLRTILLDEMAYSLVFNEPRNLTIDYSTPVSQVDLEQISPPLLTCPSPPFHRRYTYTKQLVALD